ncbi:MAG: hypothetical protein QOK48_1282 [Blastocatellia bacterium]|nr:hypothetical protein [Blastocatellia bacterium]
MTKPGEEIITKTPRHRGSKEYSERALSIYVCPQSAFGVFVVRFFRKVFITLTVRPGFYSKI